MSFQSHPLVRALVLLWGRMGPARFYVLAGAGLIVFLAFWGLVHLFSFGAERNTQRVSSSATAKLTTPPPPNPDETIPQDPLLTITGIAPRKTTLRDGSTSVVVKIGVAPRQKTDKGEVVIRVSFFDVNQDNEMRPTEAQIDYNWLTQVRDWTDPAPKYLEATYIRPPTQRGTKERLWYGGFIVRVYLNAQLQDELSDPKELLTALRATGSRDAAAGVLPARQPASTSPPSPSRIAQKPPANAPPTRATEAPVAALPLGQNAIRASTAPYANPVPDKPGLVYSPYDKKFLIDVRGVPPGTEVNDPNTGKPLRVP